MPLTKTRLVDYDKGYRLHKFEMGENTGTHVDAPSHFIQGKPAIDELALRDIVGVGIDTLSLDFGASRNFAFHVAMLKAGKYQIENMANLDALPARGATVVVGVLPVKDGSQAQARILALLP